MNAVKALYGELACDLVLFGVLLMNILTCVLGIRQLLAVLADGIARHDALRLSEAGVDGDADRSEVLPHILTVDGKGIVIVNQDRIPVHLLGMTDEMLGRLIVLVVNEIERKSDNGEDSRKYCQSWAF